MKVRVAYKEWRNEVEVNTLEELINFATDTYRLFLRNCRLNFKHTKLPLQIYVKDEWWTIPTDKGVLRYGWPISANNWINIWQQLNSTQFNINEFTNIKN